MRRTTVVGIFIWICVYGATVATTKLCVAQMAAVVQKSMPVEPRGIRGTLRVHPSNRRYLTDDGKRVIYLTGSHTWLNFQDGGFTFPPEPFDYAQYLDLLTCVNHNFIRLWAWGSTAWVLPDSTKIWIKPLPFARTGPGTAADGRLRFDLTKYNQAYFDRLRKRVAAAEERDIFVGVMLFQGFSVARKAKKRKDTPWNYHPFHRDNNINGIDGDSNADGEGYEIHELGNGQITGIQEAYVRMVVDTLNEFDNVIFEIGNECHGASTAWQYHLLRLIQRYEQSKPKQHLTWMSFQWDGIDGQGTNKVLWDSPAAMVSPSAGQEKVYEKAPPVADGVKVVIADTDHIDPRNRARADWVWKCFLRGLHPIFMDNPPVPGSVAHPDFSNGRDQPSEDTRSAMGVTRTYAGRINLAAMTPTDDTSVCSSGYCLSSPGQEYLVWHEQPGALQLKLPAGTYSYVWVDPVSGNEIQPASLRVERDGMQTLDSPKHRPLVLHLKAAAVNAAEN